MQKLNAEAKIEDRGNNSISQNISINQNLTDNKGLDVVGAWNPMKISLILQFLKGEELNNAIDTLLQKGFHEYYFTMNNFEEREYAKLTEELLKSAEKTNLKIIIILRPPSEGDSNTNYDWKGWIKYFNSLEEKYPKSFEGFTIDDFNWISTKDETKFKENIDFMKYSKLVKALEDKNKDIKFYPTIYFEGRETDVVATKYNDFTDGFIVASGCYYNISLLEKELKIFKEIFEKPIKYVVYPTITYNYSRQDYSPPTDRLIQATLSIATNSAEGLIIWRDIDNPMIQEYLGNRDDQRYLSKISNMKELQIRDEETTTTKTNIANSKIKLMNSSDSEQEEEKDEDEEDTCPKWSIGYNKAYNIWKDLSVEEREKGEWKKDVFTLLRKVAN